MSSAVSDYVLVFTNLRTLSNDRERVAKLRLAAVIG